MHQLSIVHACQLVRLSRTAYYRSTEAGNGRDAPILDALLALVAEKTRWGFWIVGSNCARWGHAWNHKRVYRVYCALRLNQARRTKKRVFDVCASAAGRRPDPQRYLGDGLHA